MTELLEEIKKLSREEQVALAHQILKGEDDKVGEDDERFKAELIRRAQEMIKNPTRSYSFEEVEAHLLSQDEVPAT